MPSSERELGTSSPLITTDLDLATYVKASDPAGKNAQDDHERRTERSCSRAFQIRGRRVTPRQVSLSKANR